MEDRNWYMGVREVRFTVVQWVHKFECPFSFGIRDLQSSIRYIFACVNVGPIQYYAVVGKRAYGRRGRIAASLLNQRLGRKEGTLLENGGGEGVTREAEARHWVVRVFLSLSPFLPQVRLPVKLEERMHTDVLQNPSFEEARVSDDRWDLGRTRQRRETTFCERYTETWERVGARWNGEGRHETLRTAKSTTHSSLTPSSVLHSPKLGKTM